MEWLVFAFYCSDSLVHLGFAVICLSGLLVLFSRTSSLIEFRYGLRDGCTLCEMGAADFN